MATNPNAALFQRSTVSKTTTYTATIIDDIILCSTAGGAWTLTLPPAASLAGKELTIKKTTSDVNALTVDGNASETINAIASVIVPKLNNFITLVSDGTNWHIINEQRTIRFSGSGNSAAVITGGSPAVGEYVDWDTGEDICGLWTQTDGNGNDTFTAKEEGVYGVEGNIAFTVTGTNRVYIDINAATNYTTMLVDYGANTDHLQFSTYRHLEVGDTMSFAISDTKTLQDVPIDHWLEIIKIN